MIQRSDIQPAVQAAIPIMLGYVAIGIPCGILCASIGLNALQVFLLSALFSFRACSIPERVSS